MVDKGCSQRRCYFRTNRNDKGNLFDETSDKIIGTGDYLNMEREARRDLARFYAESDKVDEAVRYLKGSGSISSVISLAKNLIDQGKKTKAMKVLEGVINQDIGSPSEYRRAAEALINIYADYSKFQKLESIARKLVDANNFESEVMEYNLKKSRSVIQKELFLKDIPLKKVLERAFPDKLFTWRVINKSKAQGVSICLFL